MCLARGVTIVRVSCVAYAQNAAAEPRDAARSSNNLMSTTNQKKPYFTNVRVRYPTL